MRIPAYYFVIDVEATCDDDERIPRAETEIIEIGGVLVAEPALAIEEEFQTFVRPGRHPVLTPFCTKLTSITQAQVDDAPGFPVATRGVTTCGSRWGGIT